MLVFHRQFEFEIARAPPRFAPQCESSLACCGYHTPRLTTTKAPSTTYPELCTGSWLRYLYMDIFRIYRCLIIAPSAVASCPHRPPPSESSTKRLCPSPPLSTEAFASSGGYHRILAVSACPTRRTPDNKRECYPAIDEDSERSFSRSSRCMIHRMFTANR